MPIYAYRCEACGHAKDVLRRVSDPPLSVCPACGGETFRKQVTAAGFQLKGSGWYVTDFKGGAQAPKPASQTDAKSDGEAKSGAAAGQGADAAAAGAKADTPAAAPAAPAAAPASATGGSSGAAQ